MELHFEVWYQFLNKGGQVMVYTVLWRIMQPIIPGSPGRTSSLFDKCTGFFYVGHTSHRTYAILSHPKDEAVMVLSVLLKCPDPDSNPHSAEQKHQSLSPVLLSTGPRHVTTRQLSFQRTCALHVCTCTCMSKCQAIKVWKDRPENTNLHKLWLLHVIFPWRSV